MADFLAESNRKKVKEQAARDARDAERKAKLAAGEAGATRPGFRTRRQPTKKQSNR